jgi:N-acetylneuraminic acid mutarotase
MRDFARPCRRRLFAAWFLAALTFAALCPSATAQTPEWTWVSGDSVLSASSIAPGVFGTLGKPAPGNVPPGRFGTGASWVDKNGNFWLFGGGQAANGLPENYLNDFWKFNPIMGEWTWMGGSASPNVPSTYGMKGVAAAGNIPGARAGSVGLVDSKGKFWLFGGEGFGQTSGGPLNELWEFDPATNEWTFVSGDETPGSDGHYGSLGVPSGSNRPPGKVNPAGWIDGNDNLWIFGGLGPDSVGTGGYLNDLWNFNTATREWTWISGSDTAFDNTAIGQYGGLGVEASGNVPPARYSAANWTDRSGNLWFFGGLFTQLAPNTGALTQFGDLWRFRPSTGDWTWMGGNSAPNGTGVWGTLGTPSGNNEPSSRWGSTSWTGADGEFWLFGGQGWGSDGYGGYLNDLWEYNPTANEWAWMNGASVPGLPGNYGMLGVSSPVNTPGARIYAASATTDPEGTLWLFGGGGLDAYGNGGDLNDLWIYAAAAGTPTFAPPAGPYPAAQQVTIKDATAGAAIYYTTDRSTPTTGSTKYSAAIPVSQTTTVRAIAAAPGHTQSAVASATYTLPPDQYIVWAAITATEYADSALSLRATASSGLRVSFASTTPKHCTVSGATASLLQAGYCMIVATQAGNSSYDPAAAVTQTIPVHHRNQTIAWPPIFGLQYPLTSLELTATASSGLKVSFASSSPAICTVSGTKLSLLTSGVCLVNATQAGDGTYYPKTIGKVVGVLHLNQTIEFPVIPRQVVGAQVALTATASSGLPVTFASATSSVCTVSGTSATLLKAGTCTIQARQAGSDIYYAAPRPERSFTVAGGS